MSAIGGGTVLSACGSSGREDVGFGPATSPINYRFSALVSSGDPLPDGHLAQRFPGQVMLNDAGDVLFHALDNAKGAGVYVSAATPNGNKTLPRALLRKRDKMPDGSTVARVETSCLNGSGMVAARVCTTEGFQAVYLARQSTGWELVAGYMSPVPGGEGRFSQSFGDLELTDDDELVFVAHYARGARIHHGIFALPGARLADGRLLNHNQTPLPNTTEYVGLFGLIDAEGGHYVHQASLRHTVQVTAASAGGTTQTASADDPRTVILHGSTRSGETPNLLVRSPRLAVPASMGAQTHAGEVNHGPRISQDGRVATVIERNGGHDLCLDRSTVLSSGGLTPTGRRIDYFGGPLHGPDQVLYVAVTTADGGSELLLINGAEVRTLAYEGMLVDNRRLARFSFGAVRNQVNRQGQLVMQVEYQDGTSGLVLGTPV
jgi:hypothetical protein